MKTIITVGASTVVTGNNVSLNPTMPSGTVVGDLVCIVAAIRTGAPQTPLGWTTLAQTGGVTLMGRFWVLNDTMPTVTFTGGSAGDDTLAGAFTLRNVFTSLPLLANAVAIQSNGSAQDVVVPAVTPTQNGCLILNIGFKQDDYTAATRTGYTFLAGGSSTAGNDDGFFVMSKLQTDAAVESAGTVTLTGGAAATSVSISLALRPYVTTWTSMPDTDTPCSFTDDFNAITDAAAAALIAINNSITFLSEPPAVRISVGGTSVNSQQVFQFSSVDIDPLGIADLVSDPYSVTASRPGLWINVHNVNSTFYTEGNQVSFGNTDDSSRWTSSRDANTTNNPPGGGATGSAPTVTDSSSTSPRQFSTSVSFSGFGVANPPSIIKATMQAFWVSD